MGYGIPIRIEPGCHKLGAEEYCNPEDSKERIFKVMWGRKGTRAVAAAPLGSSVARSLSLFYVGVRTNRAYIKGQR